MVYQASGTGRDSFIFLHEEKVKGKLYQPKVVFNEAQKVSEFWSRKDRHSDMIQQGHMAPKEADTFPSAKSLRAPERQQNLSTSMQRTRTTAPVTASRDDLSILHHKSMPESEKRFRMEKLSTMPVRIQGYQGHIPASKESIGVSTTSNKFITEVTSKALQEEANRHKMTNKKISEDSIRRMDRTLDMPSFRKMNRAEARQHANVLKEVSMGSTTPAHKPVKVVKKPEVEVPFTHHIPGYAGHRPRNLHSLQCYEKNKQNVKF